MARLGVNAGSPVLNPNDFAPQFVAPGTNGVPACDATGCDLFESLCGTSGRNLFRGPFQVRFDMSLAKEFPIKERLQLRFEGDAFNFNHPDFDAPNNNVTFFPISVVRLRFLPRAAWASSNTPSAVRAFCSWGYT